MLLQQHSLKFHVFSTLQGKTMPKTILSLLLKGYTIAKITHIRQALAQCHATWLRGCSLSTLQGSKPYQPTHYLLP